MSHKYETHDITIFDMAAFNEDIAVLFVPITRYIPKLQKRGKGTGCCTIASSRLPQNYAVMPFVKALRLTHLATDSNYMPNYVYKAWLERKESELPAKFQPFIRKQFPDIVQTKFGEGRFMLALSIGSPDSEDVCQCISFFDSKAAEHRIDHGHFYNLRDVDLWVNDLRGGYKIDYDSPRTKYYVSLNLIPAQPTEEGK